MACAWKKGGYFFAPTVFVDVDASMKLMAEETFGPVVGLVKVEAAHATPDQLSLVMNDSHLGLTAGVYSEVPRKEKQNLSPSPISNAESHPEDREFARAILTRVNAGTVYWNRHGEVQPWMPWSGRKQSGMGVFLSIEGIRECFTRTKAFFW